MNVFIRVFGLFLDNKIADSQKYKNIFWMPR